MDICPIAGRAELKDIDITRFVDKRINSDLGIVFVEFQYRRIRTDAIRMRVVTQEEGDQMTTLPATKLASTVGQTARPARWA